MCIASPSAVLLMYCWLFCPKVLLVLLFGDCPLTAVWTTKLPHFCHQHFLSRDLCWLAVFAPGRLGSMLSNTILLCFGGFV
jgi:hypothetical protein